MRTTSPQDWTHAAWIPVTMLIGSSLAFADYSLTTKVDGMEVTISLPEGVQTGESQAVSIKVNPAPDKPHPQTVRARVGMPAHGHWIADEGSHPFDANAMQFVADKCEGKQKTNGIMCLPKWFDVLFPMEGKYRLRVWVDYPDGGTETSAVDFELAPNTPVTLREHK